MPQGRRPTAEEVLGLQPQRPTAEQVLGLQPQRPTAEQVLGIAPQQPPQKSYYEQLRDNLGLGFQQLGQTVSDVGASAYEVGREALHGNFAPLRETAELVGRGIAGGQSLLNYSVPEYLGQQAAIGEVKQRQAQRREASGDIYFRGSAIENAKLQAEAAKDPSILGKIERGIPQALPYVAAGAVGGAPALAATGAALSLNEPENLAQNVALSAIPIGGRAIAPAVERVLGKGVAQAVEAEAGGAVGQAAQMALPGFEQAVKEAVGEIPQSVAQRIKSEVASIYALPRALMASSDLSAFRQGALLAVQPTNWGKAGRATVKMFQALKPSSYNRIIGEIAQDADARLGQQFGLELTSQARDGLRRAEEGFISKYSGRIPIVAGSERAYTVFLDSLRLDKFRQFRKIIDAQDFTAAQRENAYKLASDWVNIASGRGSLGPKLESAMPLLNSVLFAPRFVASRLNVLNPAMYIRNAGTAEGRVILKHQMSELAQYAGVVAGVLATAKAAGAEVSLNPSSSDFLKIKVGRYRYDPLSGLQQVMRLVYRTGAAVTNAARGEKVKPGEGALDIGGHFLRSKLGPVPSYFTDFALGRTYTGEKFSALSGAGQRILPIMWGDWIDAYQKEGWRGVGMVSPGVFGVGVSAFDSPPMTAALEKAQPFYSEIIRLNHSIPEIRRTQGEADDAYNSRLRVFGEGLQTYGPRLVESQQYRQADDATKKRAVDLLDRRIKSALFRQGEQWTLRPDVIMSDIRETQQLRGR